MINTFHLIGHALRALRNRSLNLPPVDTAPHEFGSAVMIPPRSPIPGRKQARDIKGFDKKADLEARWRTQGCLEMEKLIPFMKNAGVKPDIIEHAEEVLRDLQEQRRRKYLQKGPE